MESERSIPWELWHDTTSLVSWLPKEVNTMIAFMSLSQEQANKQFQELRKKEFPFYNGISPLVYISMLKSLGMDCISISFPEYECSLVFAVFKKNYDLVNLLLNLGADPNGDVNNSRGGPLQLAIKNEDVAMIRILLDKGANPLHAFVASEDQHGLAFKNNEITSLLWQALGKMSPI